MEPLQDPPLVTAFRSYSEYHSQTPESFSPSSGPPILLHRSLNATLRILQSDLVHAPLLTPFAIISANGVGLTNPPESKGADEEEEEEEEEAGKELEVSGVDIWVASDYLYLHFPSSGHRGGVRIPYSLITLHAIQSSSPPSIYLQLESSAPLSDDIDPESTLELTLIPALLVPQVSTPSSPTAEPVLSPTQALYAALKEGADMWPDHGDDEDGERPAIMFDVNDGDELADNGAVNGLPPPMPGSGGWITSANVGDFFDEAGNWRGREPEAQLDGVNVLGEGAGTVRPREDDDDEKDTGAVNGEETKWRRTD